MKNLALVILLVLGLITASCSQSNVSLSSTKPKQTRQILEITNNFSGLYWMNGEVLVFRLYDDKSVEYDEYPLNKTQYQVIQAEKVKITKHIKIDDAEFEEITGILASSEFSKIEVIDPQKSCIDAFIDTEIHYNLKNSQKQIIIRNHCSTLSDSKSTTSLFSDFPSKINNLFEIITKIKNRESAGKFYN